MNVRPGVLTPLALVTFFAMSGLADSQPRHFVSFAAETLQDDDKVVHLYVVRRGLDFALAPRARDLAHSALLLQTAAGEYYLLEYMDDSQAHLNKVNPEVKETNDDHLIIEMEGCVTDGFKKFQWTRQKKGAALKQAKSLSELQVMMAKCMPDGFSTAKENCHAAQERVRKELGLLEVPYLNDQ